MEDSESTFQKRLREELICAICLDFLRQPKVLSCAHSFCQVCLQGMLEGPTRGGGVEGKDSGVLVREKKGRREGEGREGAGDDGSEEGRQAGKESESVDEDGCRAREIECPSCRGITQLPEEGVQNLLTHTRLENLVDIVSEEEKQSAREELRQRVTKSRDLTRTPNALPRCELHGKMREYFCNQCTELLCMRCMMDGHRNHSYEDAAELLPARLAALRSQIQPAYEFVEKAGSVIEQLARDHDAIQTNQTRCRENVQDVFTKLRGVLDEREKILLDTVDKYAQGKLSAVAEQTRTLTKGREKILCCIESVSRLLERAGDIAVLCEDQALLEELDVQEQLILEVDGEVAVAMHSASYVGFKEDHVPIILQEAPKAVTLCEFYPEADSGYYASRKIVVDGGKEEDEDNAYDVLRHGGTLRYTRSMQHAVRPTVVKQGQSSNVVVEAVPDHNISESPTPTESPSASRRSSLSPVSSGIFDEILPPPHVVSAASPYTPARFSSLFAPLPILEPLKVFDRLGGSRKESVHPCGLCVIANDSIIVSDIKNHCLRMIASNGKFIDRIGSEGKGSGHFEEPCGMCADRKGNILVTQRQNPRVQKFTSSGKFMSKFGQKTLRGSNLAEPWGVCISHSGEIYVSDWDKSCVHIFQDGGRYVCTLGSKNSGVGVKASLLFPGGIACDSHGRVLVTDRGNHCVWLLQPDGSIVSRFSSKGHAPGDLYYPYGIAVTSDGRIVVSESGNHRISIFSPSGQFERCFGRKGGQPGFFDHPRHIALTSKGELVVADESNERLQVFSLS